MAEEWRDAEGGRVAPEMQQFLQPGFGQEFDPEFSRAWRQVSFRFAVMAVPKRVLAAILGGVAARLRVVERKLYRWKLILEGVYYG